jgi:hypothetical protein
MIKLIFSYYWQICLLRTSPEQTPESRVLLNLIIFIFAFVLFIQWQFSDVVFSDDILITFMAVISIILSFIIYTYGALYFRGHLSRLVQTLTCIFSAHLIIHILACPLLILDPYLLHANLKNPLILFIGVLYLFTSLGLSVWKFVITAHIFKYALSTSAIQSVLAAFGLLAVNILTVSFWR